MSVQIIQLDIKELNSVGIPSVSICGAGGEHGIIDSFTLDKQNNNSDYI